MWKRTNGRFSIHVSKKRHRRSVVLTGNVLDRFADGKAILRATIKGRLQLGHLPAPVVHEQVVEIRRH